MATFFARGNRIIITFYWQKIKIYKIIFLHVFYNIDAVQLYQTKGEIILLVHWKLNIRIDFIIHRIRILYLKQTHRVSLKVDANRVCHFLHIHINSAFKIFSMERRKGMGYQKCILNAILIEFLDLSAISVRVHFMQVDLESK